MDPRKMLNKGNFCFPLSRSAEPTKLFPPSHKKCVRLLKHPVSVSAELSGVRETNDMMIEKPCYLYLQLPLWTSVCVCVAVTYYYHDGKLMLNSFFFPEDKIKKRNWSSELWCSH